MKKKCFEFVKIFTLIAILFVAQAGFSQASVTGTMKKWYPVSVTIDGPSVDESESTFRNYRLDVTFTKGTKTFKVPGFFAADGNAGETSASSGNKWRAILTPDEAGTWNYTVSLRTGADIALSLVATAGTAAAGDGTTGSFVVNESGSNEPGFFAKGKLNYVGEHYGQFAGNKEWYVKGGPGSPEDFLGYHEFDNTVDGPNHSSTTQAYDRYLTNGLHQFPTHVADWQTGDPTWKGGKGKAIIGAINYLASIGANSLYMIPFTINDDSDNTWPWTSRDLQMSYDVSKLAQWDIVFSHLDKVGIAPLYYFCESDNSKLLDNGSMILKNPIYYREIIARFGYHLGIRFNLGEELKLDCSQQKAATKWFKDLDPYNTIIVGHSSHQRTSQVAMFNCLLGDANYDGPNYQQHQGDNRDHLDLVMWREQSAAAGKKWIVANDESWGIDNSTGSDGELRMLTYSWRTFMAGAEGMVQYTAYQKPEIGDITLENFRLIENTQKILISAKNLFQLPEINPLLPQMKNENALVGNPTGNDAPFCLAKKGQIYIVYRTSATNQKPLNLSGETGSFTVKWYDARNGGSLKDGSKTSVPGGASVDLGNPPTNATGAWAAVVYKSQCPVTKNIQVSAVGCTGASASGSGSYCEGASASVAAVTGSTCKFDNWTENGVVVSTANPYTFSISADRQLVANFSGIVIPRYTINTSSNPSTGGSTTGGGVFDQNTSITVVATPEPCYVFNNWTVGTTVVSTTPSYTFPVTASRDLVANFSAKVFTVIAEPAVGGTVSGQLTYRCADVIRVKATPNAGYKFDGWYANDVFLGSLPEDDINITSAFQLKAKFSTISGCFLPWTKADFTISNTSSSFTSNAIDISCAPSVTVSMDLSETDLFESTDKLTVSYKVNGGSPILIKELINDFTSFAVNVPNISGSTLEILVNGVTDVAAEIYYIKNMKVTATAVKQNQTITFPAIASKSVGVADFNPGATASSGLAVSYTSSNTAVATIVNGNIRVVGAGTSTITASQAGDANYNAATTVSQVLTVIPPTGTSVVTALTPWVSGTTNNKVAGSNRLMVVMVMGEHSADFSATTVTYGGQAMTKRSERIFAEGTSSRTYASIFTLNESGVNAATSGTIAVSYSATPSGGNSIYSALLGNVDQTTSVTGAVTNALSGTSITTTALSSASGDMLIFSGATAANNTDTADNGFIKAFESNTAWGDGVGGSKLSTGATEVPKFSQSASGRMVICALVVKKATVSGTSLRMKVSSNDSRQELRVYPNPTSDVLNIEFLEGQLSKEVTIFNAVGQLVYSMKTSNSSTQINLHSLNLKGVVVVRVNDGNEVTNHKVIVK